jgi:hypothetical protein
MSERKAAADEVISKNFNICFYFILFYFIFGVQSRSAAAVFFF